jgi:hypothetical protein
MLLIHVRHYKLRRRFGATYNGTASTLDHRSLTQCARIAHDPPGVPALPYTSCEIGFS